MLGFSRKGCSIYIFPRLVHHFFDISHFDDAGHGNICDPELTCISNFSDVRNICNAFLQRAEARYITFDVSGFSVNCISKVVYASESSDNNPFFASDDSGVRVLILMTSEKVVL